MQEQKQQEQEQEQEQEYDDTVQLSSLKGKPAGQPLSAIQQTGLKSISLLCGNSRGGSGLVLKYYFEFMCWRRVNIDKNKIVSYIH